MTWTYHLPKDKYYSDDYFTNPEPNVEEMPWYRKRTDPAFKALGRMGRAVAKIPGQQRVKMAHQATDFIQHIVYNGEVLSPGEMSAFTSEEYGVCHTFNAKTANRAVRRARKPGPAHGVSIVMFIEQEEYLGSVSPAAGVKVVIHNSDARPFPYEQGIDIAPGQFTSIGLRKTRFIREVPPYGTCTDGKDKPFKGRGLLYKVNYTTVACERSCLQYYTIDRCGCADVKTPAPAGAILCEEEQDACIEQVTREYLVGALACDCPLPCE
ncbi:amiloride-sensitive sodium channel subunit gamma-like [Lineus longissimus]|uniref:amiloride-sensitive sodium channel subunit gamma-like n=1 Tax=Lineus longissimus TaxID=88925 RepID=UPI00315CDEAF